MLKTSKKVFLDERIFGLNYCEIERQFCDSCRISDFSCNIRMFLFLRHLISRNSKQERKVRECGGDSPKKIKENNSQSNRISLQGKDDIKKSCRV